jgi:hypothetical protein
MSTQRFPLAAKPALHGHVYEPGVFTHVLKAGQWSRPSAHSLTSLQVTPFPEYPELQAQVKVPGPVLAQVAFVEQSFVLGD